MKLRIISAVLALMVLVSCLPLSLYSFAAEETEHLEPMQGTEEVVENPTKSSQQMLDVLKQLEGFVPRAYWDYKQWSVGYGTRCPDELVEYYKNNDITKEEAEKLMIQELTSFENDVAAFAQEYELELSQNQFDALVSFSYNCGSGWMRETSGNLYNAVISGDTGARIVYSMLLWSKAGGEYVLRNRRIAELNMYLYGEYAAYEYPENLRYVFLDGAGGSTSYEIHGFDTNAPTSVIYKFNSVPTGPDETGKTVTYEFDGWYTAREGGTKVEVLDDSIAKGDVLYAHWKLPSGTPVVVPEVTEEQAVAQVQQSGVKIYKGSQTSYAVVRELQAGETVVILGFASVGSRYWAKIEEGWILLDEGKVSMCGIVTGDEVNVRAGAGTGYAVLAQKNKGDQVTILNWKVNSGKIWGQFQLTLGDEASNGWICMDYVRGETYEDKTLESISIQAKPTKLQYVQRNETVDVSGGTLLLTYSDGTTRVVGMSKDMVTGFDNTQLGTNQLTITYQKLTATLQVEIIKATVIFKHEDGTILSSGQYAYGETVIPPADPEKARDEAGSYRFVGWNAEVVPCTGNAVYTAVFELVVIPGDVNNDGIFNDQDAVYLLYHYFFPEDYPAKGQLDMNGDGIFNDQDAVYLLYHYFFPEDYPLN